MKNSECDKFESNLEKLLSSLEQVEPSEKYLDNLYEKTTKKLKGSSRRYFFWLPVSAAAMILLSLLISHVYFGPSGTAYISDSTPGEGAHKDRSQSRRSIPEKGIGVDEPPPSVLATTTFGAAGGFDVATSSSSTS